MKRMNGKAVAMLVTIAVLLTVTIGGTVAYLAASTSPVTNVFTPGSVVPEIHETLSGNTKSNVYIKNTGTVDAYIRAKIVVTWQNADGQVYPVMPATGDYTIKMGADWRQAADGFWYYNGRVSPTDSTTELINSCTPSNPSTAPDGYTLHVEILAQAVQADGLGANNAQAAFAAAATAGSN